MHLRRKSLAGAVAMLSTLALALPAADAHATTTPPEGAVITRVPVTNISFLGGSVGQVVAVVGPYVVTTAPTLFGNSNDQVAAGGVYAVGQVWGTP